MSVEVSQITEVDNTFEVGKSLGHYCHALGCPVKLSKSLFMCKDHWRSLPFEIRSEILSTYPQGTEIRKKPTDRYNIATYKAIEWMALYEGVELKPRFYKMWDFFRQRLEDYQREQNDL